MSDLLKHFATVADFPKKGILFYDFSPLLQHHMDACVEAMSALYPPSVWDEVDYLAGIESRGFLLSAALAIHKKKGVVLIRKEGKLPLPAASTSYALEYGEATLEMQAGEGKVLIVDDVLATGGSLRAAHQLCEKVGYQVLGSMVLMDLNLPIKADMSEHPYCAAVTL